MKVNRLLILSSFVAVLAATGCKKDNKDTNTVDPVKPATPFSLTEDFEQGTKAGYDDGTVTTASGIWDLDGAILGTDAGDTKNGSKDIRIQGTTGNTKRNGIVTMNFDVKHLTSVSIKSALTNFADKQRPTKAQPTGPFLKGNWELQLSKDGGKTFTKIGNTVQCDTLLTATTFAISDTGAVRFRIVSTSDLNGSNKVRINIDDFVFNGLGDPGITLVDADGNDGGSTSTPAGARDVTAGTDAPPASGDNSNLLMGNPSNAQPLAANSADYLIDAHYYTESYNSAKGIPNWVSWHLDASNTTKVTDRLDNFAAYNQLPTGFTVVQSNSYNGSVTGFDRGHNCPSADRTSSANANSATFLMINMIPQAPNNNQQTWANLENDLRAQTASGNEVYIIMGNYGVGGVGSKSSTVTNSIVTNGVTITVPAHVWKVAVIIPTGDGDIARITANTKVIAVDVPNLNSVDSDWKKYQTTVRAIETATGYNLLSALPQSVQNAIEVKTSTGL